MSVNSYNKFSNIEGDPIVSTTHGQVRGKLRETVYGDHYYCFDGVPYAKPPLGKLRFRSPQALEPWSEVRDCTQIAPKCIQFNHYTNRIEGSEDCLFLNIYAKKLKSEKPLPVMVYIHGGGFTTGTASRLAWGPEYFMMKDVILVTIGYRLGALGFLSLPELELQVHGNAGLKDIVLALKWLKKNYHNFNGDPDNVTLFGHSSGSSATHILSMVTACEGLFQKIILMSGLCIKITSTPNLSNRFARHVGYEGPEDDNKKILDYLHSLDAEKLCDFNFLSQKEKDQGISFIFGPTIENASISDAIVIKPPIDMIANEAAWSHSMPIMLGITSMEALIRYKYFTSDPKLYDLFKTYPEYVITYVDWSKCDLVTLRRFVNNIRQLHLGDKELTIENVWDIIDLESYNFMYYPVHRYLCSRLLTAQAPTYLYRFDYDSPEFNLYRIKKCGREIRGVAHVDDLSYIFYLPESYKLSEESGEFKTIKRMMDLWTTFAACSDPNSNELKPMVWQPLSETGIRKCLNINNELNFIDWPEYEKCKTRDIYYKEAGLDIFK